MKILNIIMSLDIKEGGGAVERVCNLSKYLSLNGNQCTILTTSKNFSISRAKTLKNVKIIKLNYLSNRFIIPIGLFSWLKNNAKNYDKIHLSLNWSVITAFAFLFLYINKIDYYFSAMGWLKISGRSKFLKFIYKNIISIPMARNAKKCIAISNREIKDYLKYGVNNKNIVKIPNGIDVNYYSKHYPSSIFRKKHKLSSKKIILFIGRIDEIKGTDLLINSFIKVHKDLYNYQLIICGFDGGILKKLKDICKKNNVESMVKFIDPIWGREKISAYKSADIFVIPSRYDTMTIVALEAAILATPIIITKQCDFNEIKKSNGAVLVNANTRDISRALKNTLKNKNLNLMGKKLKKYVKNNYNWNLVSKNFEEMFRGKI
jgi:glycosyltransferase involved in cell wall biosynthesis